MFEKSDVVFGLVINGVNMKNNQKQLQFLANDGEPLKGIIDGQFLDARVKPIAGEIWRLELVKQLGDKNKRFRLFTVRPVERVYNGNDMCLTFEKDTSRLINGKNPMFAKVVLPSDIGEIDCHLAVDRDSVVQPSPTEYVGWGKINKVARGGFRNGKPWMMAFCNVEVIDHDEIEKQAAERAKENRDRLAEEDRHKFEMNEAIQRFQVVAMTQSSLRGPRAKVGGGCRKKFLSV